VIRVELLLQLLGDDRDLLDDLVTAGVIPRAAELADADVEAVLVARTLIRELDVNLPGAEIIVRMRRELLDTRRQVAQLIALLRART
jgi:hypothetical protein